MSVSVKKPSDSATNATYIVLPPDTNMFATVFGGKVMSWMDISAAIAAGKHARKTVVTASVDALHFLNPIFLGNYVHIKAMVNFVSRSSMEVGVRVDAENPLTGEHTHTSSAYFTFVALDAQGKPTPIPQLLLETQEEHRRHEQGKKRYEARMAFKKKL